MEKRSDYKEPIKCDFCDYTTTNTVTIKKHMLNKHKTKEERKKSLNFIVNHVILEHSRRTLWKYITILKNINIMLNKFFLINFKFL